MFHASKFAMLAGGDPPALETSAPTFVAASANGNGTSAAMPSGWAVDDLLIIFATTYQVDASTPAHDTPPGWTLLDRFTNGYAGNADYFATTSVFYRFAVSGDATVSLSVSDSSFPHNSFMVAYRGVYKFSPFESAAVLNMQSAASSIPYAQINTLGANRVAVQAIVSWTSGSVTSTPAASWTERVDSGNALGLAIDERTFATAQSPTPSGNQTRSGSFNWARMAFAIRPA